MGRLGKVVGITYLIISIVALYALVQTSSNYTMAMETSVKFHICIDNLSIENESQTPSVVLSVGVVNPSRLSVRIEFVDYTIYLFNKTNSQKQHEPISVYASFRKTIVNPDEKFILTYIQNASDKQDLIKYILSKDPNARLDYNYRLRFSIIKFPDLESKELSLYTYQEVSGYR